MTTKKDITYIGKDFGQLRQNLIDFTKQYFPQTYTDFNESDPGMIFIELASYVGDVLSFYADTNLKESFLEHASERGNIFDLARAIGYTPNNAVPAHVNLDVYQIIPAITSGTDVVPDYTYALNIKPGMRIREDGGNAVFRTLDSVDFRFSSSFNPTTITIYETDSTTNKPLY